MPEGETRTYKSATLSRWSEDPPGISPWKPARWVVYPKGAVEEYPADEWDVEVVFTRKKKPYVPGYYRMKSSNEVYYFNSSPPVSQNNWQRVRLVDENE